MLGRLEARFEEGVAKVVPCAVTTVEAALEKGQRLLALSTSKDSLNAMGTGVSKPSLEEHCSLA